MSSFGTVLTAALGLRCRVENTKASVDRGRTARESVKLVRNNVPFLRGKSMKYLILSTKPILSPAIKDRLF